MTGPITSVLQDQTEHTVAAEHRAARGITAGLRRQIQDITRALTRAYIALAGSIDQPLPPVARRRFADLANQLLGSVAVAIRDQLRRQIQRMLDQGREDSAGWLPVGTAVATTTDPNLLRWIQNLAGTVDDRARAILLSAAAAPQINPPVSYNDLIRTVAKAAAATALLERDTRWAVNAAYNLGVRDVTDQAGIARMWVAERDACLHCLAYSGQIAQPGESYPTGLTFYIDPRGDLKPLSYDTVWGPPMHPHCRCRQRPYAGLEGYPVMPWEAGAVDPSQALQREARRAVVRGDSGSDSLPARLRAADVLLSRGAGLPRSVEARARDAVLAGRFGG